MAKDKPKTPGTENLKPLPKPIQLNLPTERAKPRRRLHEPEPQPSQDIPYEYVHMPEQEKRHKEVNREPGRTGKRYFNSAQKAYGQRRPRGRKQSSSGGWGFIRRLFSRKRKPPGPTHGMRQQSPPRLGQGDRLYTPPSPKRPVISPRVRHGLKFWALGLIVIAFVVLGLINLFGHNAWAVYLDDRFLGYMPINREAEPASVHDDAVSHLSSFLLGADVQVNEQTVIRPTRARAREVYAAADMIRLISRNFTYQIVASAIYLDGERVATLRNISDAEHVASEIKRQFITEHTLRDLTAFEEDWQIRSVMADQEEMDEPSDVIQWLDRPVTDIIRHVIRQNDTQGALAIEFNTTIERIGYLNDISRDAILGTGNILLIEITRPRLTVRTVDQVTVIEDIPKDVEIIENPDLHTAVTNVITEGRNGEQEVVRRITKLNGIQVGTPEIVSTRILREPETRVEEVGTSETTMEVR